MQGITNDASQHVHLGYYEHGCDLEAVAFKVTHQELWHAFFSFAKHHIPVPAVLEQAPQDPELGTLIFAFANPDRAPEKFSSWVEKELLPLLRGRRHADGH